jgi:hypothetical protein
MSRMRRRNTAIILVPNLGGEPAKTFSRNVTIVFVELISPYYQIVELFRRQL